MTKKLFENQIKFLHGADYNPEQWKKTPEIIDKDIELMKLAKINVVSIGMFSWSELEPKEGNYDWKFFDEVIDKLEKANINFFMSTPSGARPVWLAEKYPEVLRTDETRTKHLYGLRHNHCLTSEVYREKVQNINKLIAERYGKRKHLLGWHISNEYGGECHCSKCQCAFQEWLQTKYQTIEELNEQWCTTFWSHTYNSWQQIESPSTIGESMLHGLNLDWKRFVTDQTIDFFHAEIEPLKGLTPTVPITTNFMELYEGLNYDKFAKELDFISWDSYPTWHDNQSESELASYTALNHDWFRSMKHQPFILMESTPSATNWQDVSKLKKPKMHELSGIQAVAHGSDSVQYFQWRKSRGASEKFHGAVIGHAGERNTRVFREVQELGLSLEKISAIVGAETDSEVAVIFDTENRWAINDAQGPRNKGIFYEEEVHRFYHAVWRLGINIDVITLAHDLSQYKILIIPMHYRLTEEESCLIESFVKYGGTVVMTYWSGVVNENDLCHLSNAPYKLQDVFGLEVLEIDALHDRQSNTVIMGESNGLGAQGSFKIRELCELVDPKVNTEIIGSYGEDFYEGQPVITYNAYGQGHAYYIAARIDQELINNLIETLIEKKLKSSSIVSNQGEGISITTRENDTTVFYFIMNVTSNRQEFQLKQNLLDMEYNEILKKNMILEPYDYLVLQKSKDNYDQ